MKSFASAGKRKEGVPSRLILGREALSVAPMSDGTTAF